MAQLIIKDMLLQRKRLIYFTLFYNVFAILILQDFSALFGGRYSGSLYNVADCPGL